LEPQVAAMGDLRLRLEEGASAAERLCLAEASEVITVCDSIADAMAAELGNGRRPVVIRNVPQWNAIPTRDYAPLKQQFDLPDECFVLL
jgi:alpha-maltose-1-phosphate synthase